MFKVRKNQDQGIVKQVSEALQANKGYCPCKLAKTPDTKCMCKDFREQAEPGLCHCGLYEKVLV